VSEKELTDSQRHELWLEDIEARLRYLEALHTPSFSSFREKELELPVVSRTRPRGDYETVIQQTTI